MGYRLEISEIKHKACGGKLFGYCDETKLKSYDYLIKKRYLYGDEYFTYGFEGNIELSPSEFKEFVELYNEDCNEAGKQQNWFINDEDIQELLKSDEYKLLQWY